MKTKPKQNQNKKKKKKKNDYNTPKRVSGTFFSGKDAKIMPQRHLKVK